MPIIKSAKKRVRTSKRNRALNLEYISKIKSTLRDLGREKDTKKRAKLLDKAFSAIDKAVKKKIIHKNKAARMKSKLQKSLDQKKKTKKK